MKNDPKSNRRHNAAIQASQAVERLLERVTKAAEAGDTPAAPHVRNELAALIERVREQYRILADRQLQAALEAALALDPNAEQEANDPEKEPEYRDDALDALEALVRGRTEAVSSEPASADMGQPEAPAPAEEEENLYEGTVRLQVYPGGSMQRVLRFVEDIGKRPQFRVLRMSGNPQREGAEIDLGLREPMPLLETLWGMGHSAEPDTSRSDGVPVITVHLHAAEVASQQG